MTESLLSPENPHAPDPFLFVGSVLGNGWLGANDVTDATLSMYSGMPVILSQFTTDQAHTRLVESPFPWHEAVVIAGLFVRNYKQGFDRTVKLVWLPETQEWEVRVQWNTTSVKPSAAGYKDLLRAFRVFVQTADIKSNILMRSLIKKRVERQRQLEQQTILDQQARTPDYGLFS